MTWEVVVANRLGIALAADRAVTLTNGNSDAAIYASGANKIFQSTATEPVAGMVYSSAIRISLFQAAVATAPTRVTVGLIGEGASVAAPPSACTLRLGLRRRHPSNRGRVRSGRFPLTFNTRFRWIGRLSTNQSVLVGGAHRFHRRHQRLVKRLYRLHPFQRIRRRRSCLRNLNRRRR